MCTWRLPNTLSTRYFVEAGKTRPASAIDGHQNQAEQQKHSLRTQERPSLLQQMRQPRGLALGRNAGAGARASVAPSAAGGQIAVGCAYFGDRWHFIIVLHLAGKAHEPHPGSPYPFCNLGY